jgi:hypothetical protein
MLSDSYGPYDLLDELDLAGAPNDYEVRVRSFMLAVCDRISDLPEVALVAVNASRSFQNGALDARSLAAARVACWNSLGSRSCDFQDPAVCRVRAAICTTFPEPDDPFDAIHNFLDFAAPSGVTDSDLLALLASHFQKLPNR